MNLGLEGKIALITGSSSGIGKGCAEVLASEGVKVIVTGSRIEKAKRTAQEIEDKYGVKTYSVELNVMDKNSIESAFEYIKENIGAIDILVNNAGGRFSRGPIDELEDEDWEKTFDFTIHSAFYISKKYVKQYKKEELGAIVNITSKSAIMSSSKGNSHYVAAKAAVIGMTRAMAKDLYEKNIRVNCLAPGYVKTADKYIDGEERTEEKRKLLLTHEFTTPEEIGNVVAMLCSNKMRQVIGAVIDATGGTLI